MTVVTADHRAAGPSDAAGTAGHADPRRFRQTLVGREVLRFVAGVLVAAIVVAIATFVVSGRDAESQAIRVAVNITQVEGHSVIEPAITEPLLNHTPLGIASFDSLVHQRLLNTEVVRVKLWNADGVVVYSDEHRLIGQRFPLGAEELAALRGGPPQAGVSDLNGPENQYERSFGKLLQVYLPVVAPNGTPLLFETYQRYEAISNYQQTLWSSFVPILGGGLLLLVIITVPLALSLARRLRTSLADREALLRRAITSSEKERNRIARDLHDGVVQNLAAVTYSLSAASRRLRAEPPDPVIDATAATVESASRTTRQAMTDLRTLIVEIAPPNLVAEGLDNALRDLLEPMTARGVRTHLDASDDVTLSATGTAVLYRVAQEALRNAGKHADAARIDVRLSQGQETVRLEIEDDGGGFSEADLDRRRAHGHVGLSLLRDMVIDAGGTLTVASQPGAGTRIAAELPRT